MGAVGAVGGVDAQRAAGAQAVQLGEAEGTELADVASCVVQALTDCARPTLALCSCYEGAA